MSAFRSFIAFFIVLECTSAQASGWWVRVLFVSEYGFGFVCVFKFEVELAFGAGTLRADGLRIYARTALSDTQETWSEGTFKLRLVRVRALGHGLLSVWALVVVFAAGCVASSAGQAHLRHA